MTTLVVCALLAVLMPYFAKIPVAIAMAKLGQYDNKHPRSQQAKLTGFGARALAAHQNCFESLAVFAVAIAVVLGTSSVNAVTETLAVTHIVSRTLYCIFYWLNLDIIRSLVWFIGLGTAIAMIVVSI
ncbi:MAPEG family protein [Pseudoalteromonas agarivorans]|uniref:MAPEG family protein n=1 Tax=Pseudoalteromonas TaxID=53246 RepID=UPI0021181359|nr:MULTISPECIES: MAPEG family protein [Pseudoalteromonas]MCQ8822122.1 MAPEG family protein [Pseudoalteromonas agarivorans]BED87618.1 membrane protein [Pseudoalteromonas sp. MM1]